MIFAMSVFWVVNLKRDVSLRRVLGQRYALILMHSSCNRDGSGHAIVLQRLLVFIPGGRTFQMAYRKKMFSCVIALAATAVILLATAVASADVYVRGYYRSNGTYVAPHYRSNPDGNFYNNWSTYGSINPYTGKTGTRRMPSYSPYRYRSSIYNYGRSW